MDMKKFAKFIFNKVFNDFKVNIIIGISMAALGLLGIIACIFAMHNKYSTEKRDTIFFFILIVLFIFRFFSANADMLTCKDYKRNFVENTLKAIKIYLMFLVIIGMVIIALNYFPPKKFVDSFATTTVSYAVSVYYFWIAFESILYFVFCIRLLNSINADYSIFLVSAVKSMLIAIAAWLVIFKSSQIPSEYSVNLLVSAIAFLYPILDMYKYVRLELNKYKEKNVIIYD